VIIRIPKLPKTKALRQGREESYLATFAYQGFESDAMFLDLGRRALASWSPRSLAKALKGFEIVLSNQPGHWEATLGKIECQCLLALFVSDGRDKLALIQDALIAAESLAKQRPDDWRAHLTLGVARICNGHPYSASVSLLKVAKMRPTLATPGLLWLPVLFLLSGRGDEATPYVEAIVNLRTGESAVISAAGFFYYFIRDFERAEKMFYIARSFNRSEWFSYFGLSLLYLSTDRADQAINMYQMMHRVMGDDMIPMPGIALLAVCRATRSMTNMPEDLRAPSIAFLDGKAANCDHVQGALAFMDRDPYSSIGALRLAAHYWQPLVLFVPFCPLFDPLLSKPEFQELRAHIMAVLNYQER
jgi:hypothetical protein